MELLQQRMKERTSASGHSSNRGSRQLSPLSPSSRHTGSSSLSSNGEAPTDRRALVVEEMLVTEENYIDDLRLCIDAYLFPLRNSPHLMKPTDVVHIFSNVEFLYFIHCEIYHQISDSVNKEDKKVATLEEMVMAISQVFIQYADRLVAIYGQYCVDHIQALDLLQKRISSNPNLKTWLDNQTEKMSQGLYLRDFLIKPIQRICKYPLLFRELIKVTAEGSQEDLQRTQDLFEEIAGRVNTNKAAQENKKKLEEIESLLDDYHKQVTAFGRVFHKESDLLKYNKKLKGQIRYCFLFSDVLIYTQKKGSRYQFKGEIPLNGSLVSDINEKSEAGMKLAAMGKDVSVGFQLTHLEAKRIYYFFPTTAAEKKDWVQRVEVLTQQAFEAEKKKREESGSGLGPLNPIGRFWKPKEANVTLNSITAKYGAMSPASAERNTVPIKPISRQRTEGSITLSHTGNSAVKQRPASMQVTEVASSGSDTQQMMKAVDMMLELEKKERAKLGERIRELEKKFNDTQQMYEDKVDQLQKVIAEQDQRYKRLEETLAKIVQSDDRTQEEANKGAIGPESPLLENSVASKQEAKQVERREENSSKEQKREVTENGEGHEKEPQEIVSEQSKQEKNRKKKKDREPTEEDETKTEQHVSPKTSHKKDSTPRKATNEEADLGIFSPRKNLSKRKENRLSGFLNKRLGNTEEKKKEKQKEKEEKAAKQTPKKASKNKA